jgi:hypothetical protein
MAGVGAVELTTLRKLPAVYKVVNSSKWGYFTSSLIT